MALGQMYHHFHGEGHPRVQGSVSAEDFQRILDRRKRVLNAADFLDRHVAGVLEPEDECLTFDDGLLSQWHVAEPILRERGLTAFWFVPTAPLVGVPLRLEVWRWIRTVTCPSVENFYDIWRATIGWTGQAPPGHLAAHTYLSDEDRAFRWWRDCAVPSREYERVMEEIEQALWDEGRSLPTRREALTLHWMGQSELVGFQSLQSRGHIIGSHSHSHPTVMAALTHEAQEIEYATSTWILDHVLDRMSPRTMSHPCNSYTPHGLDWLTTHGYVLGFRATPEPGEWGPLEVPRIDSADLVRDL